MFPITAKAVANYFLERANQEKQTLTPMKIQKLVYYAHGWYLGLAGKPLIDEEIQAWPYGPVIQSLYHEFKHYGNGQITDFATDIFWKYESGDEILNTITIGEATESITPRMPEDGTKESIEAISLLDKVWRTYSTYSAIQLSNSTHEKDSPWGKVYAQSGNKNPKNTIIPKDVIREHFGNLARK